MGPRTSSQCRLRNIGPHVSCPLEWMASSSGLDKFRFCAQSEKASAYDATLFFGLTAPQSFLFYVHQVTMHTGSPCEGCHNPVCVSIFALLVSEGLPMKKLTVLQRSFTVPIGAHLVRQFGHSKQSLKHLVHVGVLLCRDFKVSAMFVSVNQLLDLVFLHLTVKVPVALVAADNHWDVHVLFGFISQAGFGLIDLAL